MQIILAACLFALSMSQDRRQETVRPVISNVRVEAHVAPDSKKVPPAPLVIPGAILKFKWDYTAWPACTPTLRKNCINHFEIAEANYNYSGQSVALVVPNPIPAKGLITIAPRYTPWHTTGKYQMLSWTNFRDADGVQKNGPIGALAIQSQQ